MLWQICQMENKMKIFEKMMDGMIFLVMGVATIALILVTVNLFRCTFGSKPEKIELVENEWNCIQYNAEEHKYTTNIIVGKSLIPQTHTGTRNVCVRYERVK